MDRIQRLTSLFERFPGIGPRQAGRFVQFLLKAPLSLRKELAAAILDLSLGVRQCIGCMRFFSPDDDRPSCRLCDDPERDDTLLAVVAHDADLNALERSHSYRGRYFVLGGTISLATEARTGLREKELLASLVPRVRKGLKEIIIALPANPEGDFTALRLRDELAPYAEEHAFLVTMLGRGLSTGSELEYADPDTLKSALLSRR